MVTDVTSASLHAALRGLSARQRIQAQNIANVETGGYLAQRIDFESSLASELESARRGGADTGRLSAMAPSTSTSLAPTRLNGNNVNLEDEVISQEQTDLAYATVLEAMGAKLRLLRTAINGQ